MKLSAKKTLIGVAATAAAATMAVALPASSASAINQVPNPHNYETCSRWTPLKYQEFVTIVDHLGENRTLCYANPGTTGNGFAIYGVNYLASGNNKVTFEFYKRQGDTRTMKKTLEKRQEWAPPLGGDYIHKIVKITIW